MKLIKHSFVIVVSVVLLLFGLFLFKSGKSETKEVAILDTNGESVSTTTNQEVTQEVIPAGKDSGKLSTTNPFAPCPRGNTDFFCYQDYYNKVVKEKGVDKAFALIKEEYDTNSYVRSQCHSLTHVIGHAAAVIYPKVSEAYKHGDSFCWSGYYHGVMEEIINKVGMAKIDETLNTVCSDIPGKNVYSFDYYNCVHGLGHGLMAITDNELFKSLSMCDNLDGDWEKTSCYGGVFMENVMVDNKNHFTKYLKPSEPLYPCTAVDTPYKSQCYLMQTSYMLKVTSQDFNKVFGLCRNADPDYKNMCFQSLGRDASGQSLSNAEISKARCDLGQNYIEKSNCVVGAVKDFVSYFHSDVQAKHFCEILSSDLNDICFETESTYYASL